MNRRLLGIAALTTATLLPTLGAVGVTGTPSRHATTHDAVAVATENPNGIGDPYYPADGNPGYNVRRYHVRLDYFPQPESIRATTWVHAIATTRLPSFHLDLKGLHVDSVAVDDRAATWRRTGQHELVVTPARPVHKLAGFVTEVAYHGKLGYVIDGGAPSGWIPVGKEGSGVLEGEPHGCAVWYPCNDHPIDKARWSLAATLPRPLDLVSVGEQGPTTSGTRHGVAVRTFRWRLGERTATYMTGMYIGKLTFERSTLRDGTPVVSAYGPNPGEAPERESQLPEILRVLARRWGPYPAPQAGGMFVSGFIPYELETFTRPIYSRSTGLLTIVHENGHQWWGDNVSIKRWRDICLNECLASYSEWLWDEHNGVDLDHRYRIRVARIGDSLFSGKLYDMGANHEFDTPVYVKGKYFVHALRNKIGDAGFFRAMRGIQRDLAGGHISMIGLRNQLERRTGVDLRSFWREWVLHTGRPSDANLFPGDL